MAIPGEAPTGPAPAVDTSGAGTGLVSSASSKRRAASASRCSSASCACGPDARTSTSWPRSAPRVATRLRLPAGTGPAPVVRLVSDTAASSPLTSLTSRAAGRACRPCWLVTVNDAISWSATGSTTSSVVASSGTERWAALPISASRASAATSPLLAPPEAATAATISPSTIGAEESTNRSRAVGSSSRSSASSALRTALPRSIRTTTPAGPSTASIASLTRTASVPNVVSSSPAASSIRTGRPCSISSARSSAAERGGRLCETTTMPTRCPVVIRCLLVASGQRVRSGRHEQGHARRAGVLVADAALTQIAGAPLAREHRDRRVTPRLGGSAGATQRVTDRQAVLQGLFEGVDGRGQRVVHRLVLRLCLAASDDTLEPGPQRRTHLLRRYGGKVAESGPHAEEERAVERTARPADRGHQGHPDLGERRARTRGAELVQRGHGGLHPTVQVGAVVGVADRGVQLGEVVALLRDERREAPHPCVEGRRGHVVGHRVRSPTSVPES